MKKLVPGTDIPYRIVRAKRKTCCLRFLADGTLEARIPYRLTAAELERLLLRHLAWIKKHRTPPPALLESRQFRCEAGAQIPFLGRRLSISFSDDENAPGYRVECAGECLILRRRDAVTQLKAFYRDAAKSFLPPLVGEWEGKTGLCSSGLKIGSAEKSWGRCSAKREITLSLRVMMLPKECIDYIIVHELCHLKEFNHSKAFWQQVERFLPERRALEARVSESYVISLKEMD